MSILIQLENFSGPLDLLLHLIKTNEMDIYDIQMVEITEQYLGIIEQMKQLDLDVAGEFLLMAATLIHIKSRMLLPASDEVDEEEETDPRAELVRRLLEYQRYKEVADSLAQMPLLGRDIFAGHLRQRKSWMRKPVMRFRSGFISWPRPSAVWSRTSLRKYSMKWFVNSSRLQSMCR